jgi:hypothetical protein
MHRDKRNPREDDRPEAVIKVCELLEQYAEANNVTMEQAAEDALSQWTKNWCKATPSAIAETLVACKLTGQLESLVEESDEIEDVEELINRALPDGQRVAVDA